MKSLNSVSSNSLHLQALWTNYYRSVTYFNLGIVFLIEFHLFAGVFM